MGEQNTTAPGAQYPFCRRQKYHAERSEVYHEKTSNRNGVQLCKRAKEPAMIKPAASLRAARCFPLRENTAETPPKRLWRFGGVFRRRRRRAGELPVLSRLVSSFQREKLRIYATGRFWQVLWLICQKTDQQSLYPKKNAPPRLPFVPFCDRLCQSGCNFLGKQLIYMYENLA